jgi:hypothetical protein
VNFFPTQDAFSEKSNNEKIHSKVFSNEFRLEQ